MKSICFYFKIHQPFRLKRYRFFDIGNDHYYYDDFANDDIVTRIGQKSYIPAAHTLLEMLKNPETDFKCAISISGTAIEQLQQYVPEFIDLLKKLADTGKVEFMSETYAHSLASLEDPDEFRRQIDRHDTLIHRLFGQHPKILQNTELIYDDDIALQVAAMGFNAMLTAGAKHVLGWRSPDYVYASASAPQLKLLVVNDKLSDDIAKRFADTTWDEYPLTADKYMAWINALPEDQKVVNLFMNLETFGEFLPDSSGCFEFLKALPRFAKEMNLGFATPSEIIKKYKPVSELSVPYPLSWADEAKDVSAWKGNSLQREAIAKLYEVAERVNLCTDRRLKQDWEYLQSSDHFYYMSTKNLDDGSSHALFSPYDSPYSAFTNYMNVLADFLVRVEEQYPLTIENEELNSLLLTIRNQAAEIETLKKEVKTIRTNAEEKGKNPKNTPAKKARAKKETDKKSTTPKKPSEEKSPAKKPTQKKQPPIKL